MHRNEIWAISPTYVNRLSFRRAIIATANLYWNSTETCSMPHDGNCILGLWAQYAPISLEVGSPVNVHSLVGEWVGHSSCEDKAMAAKPNFIPPSPANREKFSNKSGQQIGGPLSAGFQHGCWQHSFPQTWISVPIPKHTFLLVVAQLESHGNPHSLNLKKKLFTLQFVHGP